MRIPILTLAEADARIQDIEDSLDIQLRLNEDLGDRMTILSNWLARLEKEKANKATRFCEMPLNLTTITTILLPNVPHYLTTTNGGVIPIWELTEDQLTNVARIWAAKLIQEAAKRR